MIVLLIAFFMPFMACAEMSQEKTYALGQQAANSLKQPFKGDLSKVDGYQTATPPESKIEPHQLQEMAAKRFSQSEVGTFIVTSEKERKHIDLSNDPILLQADRIINNPEAELQLEEREEVVPLSYKTITCQKPLTLKFTLDKVFTPVIKTKKVPVQVTVRIHVKDLFATGKKLIHKSIPAGHWPHQTKVRFFNIWNKKDIHGQPYDVTLDDLLSLDAVIREHGGTHYFHQSKNASHWVNYSWQDSRITILQTQKEVHPHWTVSNEAIDELMDRTNATLLSEEIIEGEETRTIEGVSVSSPIWRLRETYEVIIDECDTCTPLLENHKTTGCEYISSKCLKEIDGKCLVEERVYKCPDKLGALKRTRLIGDAPYCLDGSCADQAYSRNQDMLEVFSKLSIFQEMQKDIKAGIIFKGTSKQCSKKCLGFGNCCQSLKGWGISMGLSRCSEEEKELAKLKAAGKAVYVGTYCAERFPVTNTCIRKKSSYCCFGSRLVKAVQEQGRKQLGIGWGSPESPDCRGLTPEELSRIDFSKLDLREAYEDVQASIKTKVNTSQVANRLSQDWQARLPQQSKDPQDFSNTNTIKEGDTL